MQKNMHTGKCKKAFNFDLDINILKEVYPGRFYTNAYRDIKRFLKKNNFKWRQGSGYVSSEDLTTREARRIVIDLTNKFPWLEKCVKEFDVTDIGKEHSMVEIIKAKSRLTLDKMQVDVSDIRLGLDEQISSAVKTRYEQLRVDKKSQSIENVR